MPLLCVLSKYEHLSLFVHKKGDRASTVQQLLRSMDQKDLDIIKVAEWILLQGGTRKSRSSGWESRSKIQENRRRGPHAPHSFIRSISRRLLGEDISGKEPRIRRPSSQDAFLEIRRWDGEDRVACPVARRWVRKAQGKGTTERGRRR